MGTPVGSLIDFRGSKVNNRDSAAVGHQTIDLEITSEPPQSDWGYMVILGVAVGYQPDDRSLHT